MPPIVAIVGRPNVGKSTFFNRVISSREAIVEKTPGVTRDRNYYEAEWSGQKFTLVDTGGFLFSSQDSLTSKIRQQVLLAAEEADIIIFMLDGKAGLLAEDEEIAGLLRGKEKPLLLTINKMDTPAKEEEKFSFYKLGLGEPYPISALHGLGIGDFLDKLISLLPEEVAPFEKVSAALKIAIVGRPNVGKSLLLNTLLGEERTIVSEIPGTTRDAIDTLIEREGKNYLFIDTAGLRRRTKRDSAVEYYSVIRALKALGRADIAFIMIDATEGVSRQDQRIVEDVVERNCGLVILFNKNDLLKRDIDREEYLNELKRKLRFITYAPMTFISAKTGKGLNNIFPLIEEVSSYYHQKIPTKKLNEYISEVKNQTVLPSKKGKILKIKYITQTDTAPPQFLFFINRPELVTVSLRRFLENKLREKFIFSGTPLKLHFRKE